MTNNHYQKNHSSGRSSKGFYIALGVCLIAIGVAAWTTYDSVINYATPEEDVPSSSQTTAFPANEGGKRGARSTTEQSFSGVLINAVECRSK